MRVKTLAVMCVASLLGRGGYSAMFTVMVIVVRDLTGSDRWSGLGSVASTFGAAIAAVWIAELMDRKGRRVGLIRGLSIALFGAVLCVFGIEVRSLLLVLLGTLMFGVGAGAINLARYVAIDLSSETQRSSDLSMVVFMSAIGAVVFPLLVGVATDLAARFGFHEDVGVYVMAAGLLCIAIAAIWLFLRPDPLLIARKLQALKTQALVSSRPSQTGETSSAQSIGFIKRLSLGISVSWKLPKARLAFIGLVVSQLVMVMVMVITPSFLDQHGYSREVIGQVLSAHTAGMFGFAPLAGFLANRLGREKTIAIAGVTFLLATILCAIAANAERHLIFPGLFLLGLGWSFGLVASSSLLSESLDPDLRVLAQGSADTASSLTSGIAAFFAGFLLDLSGFSALSIVAAVVSVALGVYAVLFSIKSAGGN